MANKEHRSVKFSLKSIDERGVFEGYASVFGNVDSYNDVMVKGAFARTLNNSTGIGKAIPVCWQHEAHEPIGMLTDAREDAHGLWVKGQLILEDGCDRAKQAYALLKAGALRGMSFGYDTLRFEPDPQNHAVRRLLEVKLYEVSIVTFPANEEANVESVKREETMETKISGEVDDTVDNLTTTDNIEETKAGRTISARTSDKMKQCSDALQKCHEALQEAKSHMGDLMDQSSADPLAQGDTGDTMGDGGSDAAGSQQNDNTADSETSTPHKDDSVIHSSKTADQQFEFDELSESEKTELIRAFTLSAEDIAQIYQVDGASLVQSTQALAIEIEKHEQLQDLRRALSLTAD